MDSPRMEALARALGLPSFDLMIVADGSGSRLEQPCGWAAYAYDAGLGQVWVHLGGTTGGTNNYAELAPFVYALWHWHGTTFHDGAEGPRVELVSDSEVIVRCGNGDYGRNANLSLWASIDWFVTQGYRLHWNHVFRNTNRVSTSTDRQGRAIRHLLEKHLSSRAAS